MAPDNKIAPRILTSTGNPPVPPKYFSAISNKSESNSPFSILYETVSAHPLIAGSNFPIKNSNEIIVIIKPNLIIFTVFS